MTLLLLLRHALTDATGKRLSGSEPGIHLSEKGRQQAARLAETLDPLRVTAVYASPLERCTETAEAVAARQGLTVTALPELEEVGYGEWSGRPIAQVSRTTLWRRLHETPSTVRFPGGETLVEAQGRAVAAMDAIALRSPRGVIVAVSHADVIRLLLAHYAGVHIDQFQRLTVSPASVSAVVLGDRIPRILRVNDTGSLADLAGRERPLSEVRRGDRSGSGHRHTSGGKGSGSDVGRADGRGPGPA